MRSSAALGNSVRTLVGGVVGVFDHLKLLAVGVKFVDQVGGDLDLPAIDIVFLPLFAATAGHAGPPMIPPSSSILVGSFTLLDFGFFAGGIPFVVNVLFGDDGRIAVEFGIGKQAGGLGEVEDVEEILAVVVPEPGATADDLLELDHRIDDAGQDDVLAGRGIDAGGQQLRRGEDDRRLGFGSTSWKLLRCPRPTSPSSDVTRQT